MSFELAKNNLLRYGIQHNYKNMIDIVKSDILQNNYNKNNSVEYYNNMINSVKSKILQDNYNNNKQIYSDSDDLDDLEHIKFYDNSKFRDDIKFVDGIVNDKKVMNFFDALGRTDLTKNEIIEIIAAITGISFIVVIIGTIFYVLVNGKFDKKNKKQVDQTTDIKKLIEIGSKNVSYYQL